MKWVEAKKDQTHQKREHFMLGAYLSIYVRYPERSPSEASQPEAPIGQKKASRGRMDVTAMASLHEKSYSKKRRAVVGWRWSDIGV
jgi:hypothetical protein